jgi:heme exporter protein A
MGLDVSDLACSRGGRPILAGVGLSVADGEALMLRGPNGAGKSTLLRALAGLLPSTGRIAIDGCPRDADPDAHAERILLVGHLDAVKPQLTVGENLAFWAGLFGGDPGEAAAAFDLAPLADRPAHFCSAGQRRRLGLARLLLGARRVWLLDEPTVSLDTASEGRLRAAVERHLGDGGCAVIATHAPIALAAVTRELRLEPLRPAAAAVDPFLAGAWS